MIYNETNKILTKSEYLNLFPEKDIDDKSSKHLALKYALDIRKFEIELYWKRSTYFWAFIVSAFTAYFLVIKIDIDENLTQQLKNEIILLFNLLGLFLSVAWFFVNKGSKYWQENWEKHVDLLEDDVIGSLYKTTVLTTEEMKKKSKFDPLSSYPFSVGKINQLISFAFILLWSYLLFRSIVSNTNAEPFIFYVVISLIFIYLFYKLFSFSETSDSNGENLDMKTRVIE